MKKLLLITLSFIMATMVNAGVVTPEQALQQAQKFIQTREDAGSRTSKTPGAPAQLSMATQVSGLYVFNVANDGGFVIVSNDDRTVPILGFSDSGSIDPDDMPDNMRAWLQGYADEIVWLNEHSIIVNVPESANAPRHADRHSTTAIEPLVQTKWNQTMPYNKLCPKYDDTHLAVTGCVATAMAQVMYYTETKAGNSSTQTTKEIPAYTTSSYGLSMDAIPAGATINWSSMLLNYKSGYTTDQADAVAELMRCCGCSVQMDYASSSSAYASDVPNALKKYFDYNTTTTQCVERSLYTPTRWANIIYHELEHARPVLYAGQSSGGGHAFVCDGYKYEENADYFHINWGWGGNSDEYFLLSVLNPYEQGAGGSSTNDGFHFGQQAIIGIQKTGGTGTVDNTTPDEFQLTLNSMTLSSNPIILGNSVEVTLNIKNESVDNDYEGDIWLGCKSNDGYYLLNCNAFSIPAGTTSPCVIPFTPDEPGTYDLVVFYPSDVNYFSTDGIVGATLTVLAPVALANNATDNSAVITANKGKRCEVTLTDRTLFKDGKWNTICLPFDVVIEDSPLKGATAKTLTSASTSESVPYGTHIDLTFGDAVDKIEAGKPYIIRWEPAAENIVNPVFVDVLIKDIPESDRTISMAGGNVQFIGYYDAFGIDDTNDNLFYMNSDGKLAHTGTGRTLLACRAYFLFSEYTSSGKLLVNFGDEETTAITTTNVTNDTNGGNAWYSLDGRKLLQQPARKGVYIHDGVKVVIK